MKKSIFSLVITIALMTSLLACSAPHQPLKVHTIPGQPQKPSGCVMEAGHCKPANT